MLKKSLTAVLVAFLAIAAAPALVLPAEAGTEKAGICHAEGNGRFRLIEVSTKALKAHTGHGDAQVGEAVPGMQGYVFSDGCVPEESGPEPEPIEPGCYDSSASWADLEYVGPANTAGNVIAWASTNGTCSVFELEDRDAVVSALNETEAAALCAGLGLNLGALGPLIGSSLAYPAFPADAWYCNAPD